MFEGTPYKLWWEAIFTAPYTYLVPEKRLGWAAPPPARFFFGATSFAHFVRAAEASLRRKRPVLPLLLGKQGRHIKLIDLSRVYSLLVAGMPGGGKSNFLRTLIFSLLCWAHPGYLRVDLIDLKLLLANSLKRLINTYTSLEQARTHIKRLVVEVQRRSGLLAGFDHIVEYNKHQAAAKAPLLPFRVLIIDEYATLILEDKQLQPSLMRLVQMGRALGIYVVLSTQRPDTDIVTGAVRANFAATACFRVRDKKNSEIALGFSGAETLQEPGSLLFSWQGDTQECRTPLIASAHSKLFAHKLARLWAPQEDEPLEEAQEAGPAKASKKRSTPTQTQRNSA